MLRDMSRRYRVVFEQEPDDAVVQTMIRRQEEARQFLATAAHAALCTRCKATFRAFDFDLLEEVAWLLGALTVGAEWTPVLLPKHPAAEADAIDRYLDQVVGLTRFVRDTLPSDLNPSPTPSGWFSFPGYVLVVRTGPHSRGRQGLDRAHPAGPPLKTIGVRGS